MRLNRRDDVRYELYIPVMKDEKPHLLPCQSQAVFECPAQAGVGWYGEHRQPRLVLSCIVLLSCVVLCCLVLCYVVLSYLT